LPFSPFALFPFHFSRTQLGVILFLGAALLLLWAWRGNFGLAPTSTPSPSKELVFVEVAGAAARPGVYAFPHPPTLPELWHKAGGPEPVPADKREIASGSVIEIGHDGRYRVKRMSGPQLLTLGLALDLNAGTQADLEALPGIGPVLAGRIIAYRQNHGPFPQIEDLQKVSGIGPKNLEQIRPYLTLGTP